MKRTTPVTRDELRRLNARMERIEAFQNEYGPMLRWLDINTGKTDGRLERLESRLGALLRAAEANPEALHELALAALAGVEPSP